MTLLEKLQTVIILAAVFIGLALGNIPIVATKAGHLILPFLVLMLTGAFLNIPFHQLAQAFQHRQMVTASLLINFIWTPLLAWLLGWLFLRHEPALWIGLVMLLVTPCTDWYIVFTGIARGNVPFSIGLLPINLLLQIVLLPVYLFVLVGTLVPIDGRLMVESVAAVLLLPLLAAFLLRRLVLATQGADWFHQRLLPRVQASQILFLSLAIAAMFASEGRAMGQNPRLVLVLLPPLLLFFGVNLGLGLVVGRVLRATYADVASLCCTTLARNSPIALAIALVAFPEQPLIALALVIGPLIELPVLGLVSQILLWVERRGFWQR